MSALKVFEAEEEVGAYGDAFLGATGTVAGFGVGLTKPVSTLAVDVAVDD